MRHLKQWTTALLAFLLALAMTAGAPAEAQPAPAELFGSPWYNITVIGNLPDSAAEAKDDLYSYYNYDFAAAHQDAAASVILGGNEEIRAVLKDALADESLQDPAVEQLRIFHEQAMDLETRKKGNNLEEVLPYLAGVAMAENLDQMEKAILAEDFPFHPFMNFYIGNDYVTGRNCVNILARLTFSDEPAAYDEPKDAQDQQMKTLAMGEKYQMMMIAYTLMGKNPIEAMIGVNQLVSTERAWAVLADSTVHYMAKEYGAYAKDINSLTLEELEAYCPHYPIRAMLKKYGKDQSERFLVTAPQWLAALDSMWKEENLESLRELIIAKTLLECLPYVDRTGYNAFLTSMGGPAETAEENAWNVCSGKDTFGQLIARLYTERVLGEKAKERLTTMAEGLLKALGSRISETAWISETARIQALEKIGTMKLNILEPEGGYRDYSSLELVSTEDGGSLLTNYFRIKKWMNETDNARIGTPGLASLAWDVMNPVGANAFYDPSSNSINILPGFLAGGKYTDDISEPALLGSAGTVIGHEICHGFDFCGSQLNAATAPVPLFSAEDEAAFLSLVKKIVDYYNTIEVLPGMYEDGELLKMEAAADLAGLQITLDYAKALGYEDLEPLFGSFARLYANTNDRNMAAMIHTMDTHPAQYVRVNVNAQMADEFYDTFNVKEGDNMYIAPESRLRIWGADANP